MRTFREIKANYRFSEPEIETLNKLLPVVEPHADSIVADFYNLFRQIPDTAKYLQDEAQVARLQAMHRVWLLALFQGPFEERYFLRLQRIGHAHVRIGLSAHFVYVGMNLIRQHLHQIITTEVDPDQQEDACKALEKILDLNLDVIARTYHEEEIRRVFLSQKLDSLLIQFSQRFTFGLNILLVLGLLALSLAAIVLIIQDVISLIQGNLVYGLVATMGSVLILWVIIELLDMEIDRLRGGAFKLRLFVGVALVAFIRKVLVTSLKGHDLMTEGLYLAGILVCGVIFWLVSRAEAAKQ
ncbi:MAG TPA: protoglobin domain-containing protein [Desulfobaccales bacterium]|nr:protoglobin domain-containing protein [Desulfobaccales bacterium]